MLFSSVTFLWIFFPVVFLLNLIVPKKFSNYLLVAASLVFYAWGEPVMVLLLIGSIIINWLIGRLMEGHGEHKKVFLVIGIILNLLALGYYKYADFLISVFNMCCGRVVIMPPQTGLPIGISFFTFQAISYIVDIYRGEVEGNNSLINTALYISFFPRIMSGPIEQYHNIATQLDNRTVTLQKASEGFRKFIYGLAKKVLIANVLGKCADGLFGMDAQFISGTMSWVAALVYTLQIYYDFSGYSDMAIGLGRMFGFTFLENFDYPYLSKSIGEFWRRWHISLGSWFREYVYIPLGGNRKGKVRTDINLMIVFLLTGLWHGANFTFILWGIYHGILSVIERHGLGKLLNKSKVLSRIYLLLAVIFGWVLFRADTVMDALRYIKRMLMPWQYTQYDITPWLYLNKATIFAAVCAVLGMGLIQSLVPEKIKSRWKNSPFEFIYCTGLLILSIMSMASNTYNAFIYFQF